MRAHVKDGVITRLETDDRPDSVADPQLRACVRGRSYLRRQYHPDRLQYPMKRVGRRGEGKFQRISWDEALDTIADEMQRIKGTYGNGAFFIPYGTGGSSNTMGADTASRLLNMFGGYLEYHGSYSWSAIEHVTPFIYGTNETGNQRQDWLNSKYIIMWSWNPAEMRDGTNTEFFLKLARQNGAKIICIDPRMSMSAVALADEWIPIRPGTDVAMMSAMAYVMINENLYDADFVNNHCVGFDSSQMPPGCENEESYKDYVLGIRDGVAKTPGWAEAITGVPADTITRIAREYATVKPGVLYQGYGMQRRAYGEQPVFAGCVLAAITGNVGIPGGWASGMAYQSNDGGPLWAVFPLGENDVKAVIPCFLWTDAVTRGTEMTPRDDGITGVDRLETNIKMIYAVAANTLVNQHSNINRSMEILENEDLVEFIVVQDQFMTSSGRYADIVLPVCTQYETWGVEDGWKYGDELIMMPKVVEPLGESKSDYRICADIAERLGIGDAYTEGRDEYEWASWCVDEYRKLRFPNIPSFQEMLESNVGVYSVPVTDPAIAFEDFRADPEAHPLDTPSGKIEIFSKAFFNHGKPDTIPAVPKYIQEWESPFGEEAVQYPLQAMGHHPMGRVHSSHANNDWLQEAFPQRVFVNPIDAKERGIVDGEEVRVFNDRGTIIMPCRITGRIMPGVINVPEGAWAEDVNGVDIGGSVNVLTSNRQTPLASGTTQHTMMVQIERAAA
jgi:anaerobic dimethyl sulfoxide reductase subunit A